MTATADTELAFAGPATLAGMVRAGEVHPRELVELYLRRIEMLNPRLNAFRTTLAEGVEAELARTNSVGAGQSTTKGSRSFGPPATADAEAVRRLRAAGAIRSGSPTCPS